MEDLIEVIIKECTPDFNAGQYRVVLIDRETGRVLTIWVGQFEGGSITLGLEQTWTPRPLTHDLMAVIITQLNATVERIVITDLRDNTFFAIIYLNLDERIGRFVRSQKLGQGKYQRTHKKKRDHINGHEPAFSPFFPDEIR